MENAVDALKIAFALFVLVIALSLAMYMFTQAKETADIVIQKSDVTEFMDYTSLASVTAGTTTTADGSERIVGLETIIPTLYRYYKENYTVVFLDTDGSPLTLYETQTQPELWSGYGTESGYINKYYSNNYSTEVCSFDVNEETSRYEPWVGSNAYYKLNLDMFLSGGTFVAPSGNGMDYNYATLVGRGGFVEQYKESQFIEYLGEYTYESTNLNGQEKRVIIYQLMS